LATVDKDFKVKNGLVVANGGSFGGSVVVGEPTLSTHAATKAYVDAMAGGIPVDSTPPSSPDVYYNSSWLAIATLEDAETLQDHIHDTSIDGNGLIVTMFVSGGTYSDPGVVIEGGSYNTSSWSETWDGGVATDNFN